MPRPGVTREQVHAAAEALVAEGQSATVVAVRQRLGGGSPNTITPLLAEWRAGRAPITTLPTAPTAALRQVWTAAVQAALIHLEAEREAVGAEALDRERRDLLAEIERLDRALEQAQAEAIEAHALANERGRLLETQRTEALEAQRRQVDASVRISRLEADAEHARTSAAASAAETEQLRAALAAVTAERDGARLETERLKVELGHTRAALDISTRKVEKARAIAQEEHRAHRATERALAELRGAQL